MVAPHGDEQTLASLNTTNPKYSRAKDWEIKLPIFFVAVQLGLGEDGSMNAISRSSESDKKFHVTGALVVAPDKALSHAL
jgi:hypothetical protein